eukprot:TRINITY_DN23418_c0_g1_i1.p4 TRINITY_DN23418_c0_g1~~TRINITY_DN23418_c0_g1_i1.p4  ORF type:complete len:126 (-),score=6.75 TRINITY_DN23418_c0_g1_i1:101-478(-)
MGVPEKSAALIFDLESVSEVLARLDRTLSDVCRSVRPRIPHLLQSVPVNGGVVFGIVADIDDDKISLADSEGWPREHSIHRNGILGCAEPGDIRLGKNPVESADGSKNGRYTEETKLQQASCEQH